MPVSSGIVTSCSVAAAMHLLETRVIDRAALRHFGTRVVAINHAGSYSCRRLYGRSDGAYSEHATADAIAPANRNAKSLASGASEMTRM